MSKILKCKKAVTRIQTIIIIIVAIIVIAAIIGVGAYYISLPAPKPTPTPTPTPRPLIKVREIELLSYTRAYDPRRFEAVNVMVDEWTKLGIRVKVNPVASSVCFQRIIREHNYDIGHFIMTSRAERWDELELMNKLYHSQWAVPGGYNWVEWKNAEYDKIIEEAIKEVNATKRRELVFKLQEMRINDAVDNVWGYILDPTIYNDALFKGWVVTPGFYVYNFWTVRNLVPQTDMKTLVVSINVPFEATNPLTLLTEADMFLLDMVYDRLVRVGPGGEARLWAATAIKEVSTTNIEVKIRPNLMFQDGKPCTVDDVKFTYDYLLQYKPPYIYPYVQCIDKVTIINASALRFEFKYPYSGYRLLTLGMPYILPKHIWENIVPAKIGVDPWLYAPKDEELIGSGMMKLVYKRKAEEAKLVTFAQHFSPLKIDTQIIKIIVEPELAAAAVVNKEVHVIGKWTGDPALLTELDAKYDYIKAASVFSIGFYLMMWNTSRDPLNSTALRQAMSCLIPREKMCELMTGLIQLGYSTVSPALDYWHNPYKKWVYDPERAKTILKGAGYQWDKDGDLCYPAPASISAVSTSTKPFSGGELHPAPREYLQTATSVNRKRSYAIQ